jgi:hypothetical protein
MAKKFNFKKDSTKLVSLAAGAAGAAILDKNILSKIKFLDSDKTRKLRPFVPGLVGVLLAMKGKQESVQSAGLGMIAYSVGVGVAGMIGVAGTGEYIGEEEYYDPSMDGADATVYLAGDELDPALGAMTTPDVVLAGSEVMGY